MLHLAAVDVNDEPEAVAVVRPPAEKFDARAINRKAVAAWPILFHMLVDLRGSPSGEIRALNPSLAPIDPNRARPADQRRLTEFSGVSHWENADGSGPGAWHTRAPGGGGGKDVISLIQWLATDCDRRVAADYLKSLCDRIAVVNK
jgi:hypothetical protein